VRNRRFLNRLGLVGRRHETQEGAKGHNVALFLAIVREPHCDNSQNSWQSQCRSDATSAAVLRTAYEADFSDFVTMNKPNPKPSSVVIPKTP
jgi:hypothetical protein